VPGQEIAVTVSANDPGAADMAGTFQYQVYWGDGTTSAVVGGPASGVTFSKVYTGTGTFQPWAWITDKDGATSQGSAFTTVSVVPAALIGGTLYVGGTTGNDNITVKPADASGGLAVTRNGSSLGTFNPTGDVVVYGLAGADQLTVSTAKIRRKTYSVADPVYLFGGDGNDTLDARGSAGGAVLSGGLGDDSLTGGSDDDALIGGGGADVLHGGGGSDILIGGIFDYDGDLAVLRSIGAEWWRTDASLAARVKHLSGTSGGGLNAVALNSATVHDDALTDQLYGESGTDWFFSAAVVSGKDALKDFASGEYRSDV
jgi:Ca2+-binding RTX toxin-like protein